LLNYSKLFWGPLLSGRSVDSLGYMFVTGSMALTLTDLMQMSSKATEFSEIMQNNGHYAFQGDSRSPILVPI